METCDACTDYGDDDYEDDDDCDEECVDVTGRYDDPNGETGVAFGKVVSSFYRRSDEQDEQSRQVSIDTFGEPECVAVEVAFDDVFSTDDSWVHKMYYHVDGAGNDACESFVATSMVLV